jgi:hypothetical protein
MIPRYDIIIDPAVPVQATFWIPTAEEFADMDQLGDFHDAELVQTDLVEAQVIADAEAVAVAYADAHSTTAEEFDEIADQTKFECPDLPSDEAPEFMVTEGWGGVGGLELGVAGLVYALNAVGILTAASCRSHSTSHRRWADYPIVIFAASRQQLQALQPLVEAAGCGFDFDEGRPKFIGIYGPSVVEMMRLTKRVLEESNGLLAAAS